MKIYTKSGDKGQTQVYADKVFKLPKNADVVECYGTLDELNAHIGLLGSQINSVSDRAILEHIQQNLFQIGFAISANSNLSLADVELLEQHIDTMQATLPPQISFILPSGCVAACQAHVCRTVARRAERRMVALTGEYPVPELCLQYLNRLSDYLFVVARMQNFQSGVEESKV